MNEKSTYPNNEKKPNLTEVLLNNSIESPLKYTSSII